MSKIILASKSPRRKEIMEKEGYEFSIVSSDIEIDITGKKYNDDLLLSCVESKLNDVINKSSEKNVKIIAADTVVVDDIIIGKPKDRSDAINILKNLSGKTHFVATGVIVSSIINGKLVDKKMGIDKTFVTFRKLSDKEIEEYVDKMNPLDKAGSYGIQDEGFDFCIKLEGDIDNVIGLPIKLVNKFLDK